MNRILAAATVLLLSIPAQSRPGDTAASPPPAGKTTAAPKAAPAPGKAAPAVRGKPQAPVAVSAKLDAGRATVTVQFHSAATAVTVEVHGVDGVVVSSAAVPLSGGRFARGQAVTFDVAYTEGPTPGLLAVSVSGDFPSGMRIATASFATGTPTPAQLKSAAPAATDSTGRRIKAMPVE
jgi:hypothetical protein